MRRIDREVDRMVAMRTEEVGGGSVAPTIRPPTPDTANAKDRYRKEPPSTNPAAAELEYPTGESSPEEVLRRLEEYTQIPANAERLTLPEVLKVAQKSSREFVTAEEEYFLAAIRLLIEKHQWGPRFFDDVTTSIDSFGSDTGSDTALNVINELRATQRLPYGGELEARLVSRATEQLSDAVDDEYTQSSALVLSASIPLLRNAGMIAQESLIQAERDLVYSARAFENFRRSLFVDIARDYFNLIAQQAVIKNQEERLQSIMQFLERTRALVEAGRERPFQAKNIEQNVLTSRNSLISQRETYVLSVDRFKIRLGIPVEKPIALDPISIDLDDPRLTVEKAAELALRYRLDYQNRVDQIDDSRRGVANARNQLLPDLNTAFSTTFGTNDDDRIGGLDFEFDDADWRAGVTFGLPLDREVERLQLRASMIALERSKRDLDEFRDNLILTARQAVREIDRARLSLRLQEQAVQINELRLEEILLKEDEVDPQTRLDAENELLSARNSRDQALRDLRVAILEFLRITGQLRIKRDGTIEPLAGMEVRMIEQQLEAGEQDPEQVDDPQAEPEFRAPPGQDAAGVPQP